MSSKRKQIVTADDRAERDQALAQAHARVVAGVEELIASGDFDRSLRQYLDWAARFPAYSWQNVWLIRQQAPQATRCAGYGTWQQAGRQVRKGETGLRIFAPVVVRQTDDETGEQRQRMVGYRLTATFDISQTDPIPGKWVEPPALAETLQGDADQTVMDALAAYAYSLGLRVSFGDDGRDYRGYYSPDQHLIYVKQASGAQMFKTFVHELAHATDPDLAACGREEREWTAETTAYMVAQHYGLDTASYSFAYLCSWLRGQDDPAACLGRVMQRTCKIAKQMIAFVDEQIAAEQANLIADTEGTV